jgi:hypothetical protein
MALYLPDCPASYFFGTHGPGQSRIYRAFIAGQAMSLAGLSGLNICCNYPDLRGTKPLHPGYMLALYIYMPHLHASTNPLLVTPTPPPSAKSLPVAALLRSEVHGPPSRATPTSTIKTTDVASKFCTIYKLAASYKVLHINPKVHQRGRLINGRVLQWYKVHQSYGSSMPYGSAGQWRTIGY